MDKLKDSLGKVYDAIYNFFWSMFGPRAKIVVAKGKINVWVDTDAARFDVDDELTLWFLIWAHITGKINLCLITINTHSTAFRWNVIVGLLELFGMKSIPVALGDEILPRSKRPGPMERSQLIPYFRKNRTGPMYYAPKAIETLLKKCPDNSLAIVGIGAFTNIANAMKSHPKDFKRATWRLTAMSGAENQLAENGFLVPDAVLYGEDGKRVQGSMNNQTDPDSADFMFKFAQSHKIDFWVVTKVAAYQTKLGHRFLEKLTPLGESYILRIRENARKFYQACVEGKFKGRTVKFFLLNFCGDENLVIPEDADVADYVIPFFPVYDLLAAFVGTGLYQYLFAPVEFMDGRVHLIGHSKDQNGLVDPAKTVSKIEYVLAEASKLMRMF